MVGDLLGSYRILRPLGEGGMGAVFEAVHEGIERRVAVKVLHPDIATPQVTARFLNEARAASRIHHLGVVTVFDCGCTPAGLPYLVMELLSGESLRHRLTRLGALGEDALRIARQVASALCAAHDKGVVHRDLKPDNVMLVPDGEAPAGERVKVLDFGIAKLLSGPADAAAAPLRTRTGFLLGTPAYMAPEQCRGLSQIDDRVDVYALGVMLYEMVAGAPPFGGDMGELIALHLYTEPPPLRARQPAAAAPVEALVGRMLAKSPAERPSMAEVAAELERIGAPRATTGPMPPGDSPSVPILSTLGHSAAQQAVRHRGAPRSALLLGLAALLLGGAGTLHWLRRTPDGGDGAAPSPLVPDRLATQVTPSPKTVTLPPPPRRVRWAVRSDPPGAQVVNEKGEVLGTTPYRSEQDARPGVLRLVLRREGFAHRPVSLARDRHEDRDEQLEPLAPPVPKKRPRKTREKYLQFDP